jgi:xanthine/CO dehydrogenase XdhC/CoxF family maturation factor
LVDETVIRVGELAGSDLEAEIIAAAEEARMEQRSRLIHLESADIFVEWVAPPPDVFLFGAGHDVIPVNEMAQILGWRVTIAENRPGYARPERFPGAERVIALGPDSDIGGLGIHSEAAVVVMTHNFPLDRIIVPQILDRRPKYLGLLGPKTRAEQLFREMGRPLPDWDIHAPVGLDLGGEGPQSIAIAIVAEIQSVLHGRSAGPLRLRNTPIHKPALVVGSKPQTGYGLRAGSEAVVCETRLAPQHA